MIWEAFCRFSFMSACNCSVRIDQVIWLKIMGNGSLYVGEYVPITMQYESHTHAKRSLSHLLLVGRVFVSC